MHIYIILPDTQLDVSLIKSQYKTIKQSVSQYPRQKQIKNIKVRNCIKLKQLIIFIQQMSEYFRKYIKKDYFPLHPSQIRFKTSFNNCILTALQGRGYKQTDADDWLIYWCQKQYLVESLDKMRLFPNKRINHFRNWYEICRKDLLAKNIKRYKRQLQKQGNLEQAAGYDYTPLTYNLPTQYPIFLQQYKRANKAMWIMKPIGKSQGKGIFLFNKIADISDWSEISNQPQPYIVQRYIHNPLLIGNKKFDMRLYALVTSHNPLTVYIYRSGFARFTHMRYQLYDTNALESHLTNVAIQKNSQNYDEQRGGKYFVDKLRIYLNSKYGTQKIDKCFFNVQEVIIKTLIATCKIINNDKKCFQLYGYDIMIDSNLKPWLIEINGSPSMSANTQADSILKNGLLDDVFTIVNLERILNGQQTQIGGFDLVYKDNQRIKQNVGDFNGNVNPHINFTKQYSMIGCLNNRDQNLRKMAKLKALKLAEEHSKSFQANSTSNTNAGNTRNQSINRVGQNINNTQRGRSVVLNGKTQVKQMQSTNVNKPIYQPNSSFGIKKNVDEGLKLPKVTSTSSNLVGTAVSSGKLTDNASKKPSQVIFRTGSRESKR